jgi:hypothetical protein
MYNTNLSCGIQSDSFIVIASNFTLGFLDMVSSFKQHCQIDFSYHSPIPIVVKKCKTLHKLLRNKLSLNVLDHECKFGLTVSG